MAIDEQFTEQVREMQKLSYRFYAELALGGEPLTYSCKNEEGSEIQIEVNASVDNERLIVVIDADTGWSGRWSKTRLARTFLVSVNDRWQVVD